MNASATDPGTPLGTPLGAPFGIPPAAELATEVDDPNCLLPPVRQRLFEIAKKLSNVGSALVETVLRVIYGLEGPPVAQCGSLTLAMERIARAAALASALLQRVRAGIVVTRPASAPKQMAPKDMAKQPRKPAPAPAGVGRSPRGDRDPAAVFDRMTDAAAFAFISKQLTLAAKAIGYTDVIAEVAALAREAAELLTRPPAPLPRARLAEAEIQRRRAERAAAAAMGSEGSSVAYAAARPPLPPDSG